MSALRTSKPSIPPAQEPSVWVDSVWPLLGAPIPLHRRLCQLAGDVKAGLMMSLSVHWTRQAMAAGSGDGWLACTGERWTLEAGLSIKEQATARSRLREFGLIEERRTGQPARLEHRVVVPVLQGRLLELVSSQGHGASSWRSPGLQSPAPNHPPVWSSPLGTQTVVELLGPTVALHRSLVEASGGVNTALLMSWVLHRMRGQLQRGRSSWVHGESGRLQAEVGLTRREQETARTQLRREGLWEERMVGTPPRMLVRVHVNALAALLRMPEARSVSRALGAEFGAPTDTSTGPHKRAIQGCGNPTSLIGRKRHLCFAESAKLKLCIGIDSCYRSLSPQCAREAKLSTGDDAEPIALVVPAALSTAEQAAAKKLVSELQHVTAQAVLDELSGRLSGTRPPRSPMAYLQGLVARARAGTFFPELAKQAFDQRRSRDASVREAGLGSKSTGAGSPFDGTAHPPLSPNPIADVSVVQLHRSESLRQLRELSQRLQARTAQKPASHKPPRKEST
jgi:hypothetical protein